MSRLTRLTRRQLLSAVLGGVLVLVVGALGLLTATSIERTGLPPVITPFVPGGQGHLALERAGQALGELDGYTLHGSQATHFSGPGVPPDITVDFEVGYAAPDRLSFVMHIPFGPDQLVTRRSVSIGDEYYAQITADTDWFAADRPFAKGFDLRAAHGLPELLATARSASDPQHGELDGKPALIVRAVGSATHYPTIIDAGFESMVAAELPFTAWLDPDTGLPLALEFEVTQLTPSDSGMELRYTVRLDWESYAAPEVEPPDDLGHAPDVKG